MNQRPLRPVGGGSGVVLGCLALVAALWVGLTAPATSPVAPAVVVSPAVASPAVVSPAVPPVVPPVPIGPAPGARR